MHISEVRTNQTLHVWMKSIAPLKLVREPRGRLYYQVVSKSRRIRADEFTHFAALVMRNDPANKLIFLSATPIHNPHQIASGLSLPVTIHYSSFHRVQLISAISYPGSPTLPLDRPTKVSPLSNVENKPYHTAIDISVK